MTGSVNNSGSVNREEFRHMYLNNVIAASNVTPAEYTSKASQAATQTSINAINSFQSQVQNADPDKVASQGRKNLSNVARKV